MKNRSASLTIQQQLSAKFEDKKFQSRSRTKRLAALKKKKRKMRLSYLLMKKHSPSYPKNWKPQG